VSPEEVACSSSGSPPTTTCGSTTATAGWSGPERGKRSESVEEALEPGRYLIRVSGFEGAADPVHRYGLRLDAR